MKIAIIGSRAYPRIDLVIAFVRALPADTIVVSGGAPGVDQTAETAARKRGLRVESILAEWHKYGKQAGFLRNTEIVARVEKVIAFWDEQSRGTADSIRKARMLGKSVVIFGVKGERIEE